MTSEQRPQCELARRVLGAGDEAQHERPSRLARARNGELPPLDPESVRTARAHAAACPACAALISRDATVGASPSGSAARGDDAERVLRALAAPRGRGRGRLRAVLVVLSVLQLLLALPWLFGASVIGTLASHADAQHLTRDGALGVAVGVAGLAAGSAIRYARAMATIGGASLAVQLTAALVDSNASHVGGGFETVHLLAIVIVALVAALAWPRRPGGRSGGQTEETAAGAAARSDHLRLVR